MKLNLYIDGVKVDLFKDETITVTDTIQDVKELDKVKTIFTREFKLPGSKTNNKLFAYYHDIKVQNSFDARYRKSASIHLNGVLYRKGSVRLLDVSLKDDRVYSYSVSFVGNTVTLPDAIEDDTLDSLDLSAFDHDFNITNVRTGLQSSLSSGDIIYPLIYHTNRYVYTTSFQKVGTTDALDYKDLKPAISLTAILDAIEAKYDAITWASGGFWEDTDFAKLYMWCHRDEGEMVGGNETQQISVPYSEWSYTSGGGDITPITSSVVYTSPYDIVTTSYSGSFNITPSGSELYDVTISDEVTGAVYGRWTFQSGTTSFVASFTGGGASGRTHEPKVTVSSSDSLSNFTIDLDLTKTVADSDAGTSTDTDSLYDTTTTTFTLLNEIYISSQIPEMGIMDFLAGLFKMFNLTAYVNSDNEIVVETIDTFYARANEWDLTKYVISDSHKISRTVPFSKIEYKFSDPTTTTAIEWNRRFGVTFGSLDYVDVNGKYDGDTYEVELPFEKLLYEAQFTTATTQSDLTSGLFLDKKLEPTIGEPLIFYAVNTSCSTTPISWLAGAASNSTTYNRPANISSTGSINFGAEIDEHTLALSTDSLFADYHTTYIENVFDRYSRRYDFKAVLPLSFIMNYEMYDTIIIDKVKFRINKIDINLMTRQANLELINIVTA